GAWSHQQEDPSLGGSRAIFGHESRGSKSNGRAAARSVAEAGSTGYDPDMDVPRRSGRQLGGSVGGKHSGGLGNPAQRSKSRDKQPPDPPDSEDLRSLISLV